MSKNHKSDVSLRDVMADAKFFEAYSRWDDENGRYETWGESVARVMDMHRERYAGVKSDELEGLFREVEEGYRKKLFLGAQRALQFGGDQILKKNMRMFNCTSTYADRASYFGEFFWVLLCGAGAGVSVRKKHVNKLPDIATRTKSAKIFKPEDSIEGWAKCADVLMSSYFVGGGKHPEYEGRRVYFDLSEIRPEGAFISGGFKAPGPEPLRRALDRIEYLIQGMVLKGEKRLRPIHVYDISMHLADAVLAGGVRRSATLFIFDPDDEEMVQAKTGNWFIDNPQRGRSNNSAGLIRKLVTKDEFDNLFKSTKEFGEPGFVFTEDDDVVLNPCVEIGMYPQIDGQSGWQGCNLTEINGSECYTKERFLEACRAAAIMGTLQAGYTDFEFLGEISKRIFDREALLGVSITGWMNSPEILLDEKILQEGARVVLETNEEVAKVIGINKAARTTCVKPAGNASVLLGTASGVHAEHSERYFRVVQMNKNAEVAKLIKKKQPYMVEDSVHSAANTDYAIFFPIVPREGSVYKSELSGTKFLDMIKMIQNNWIEYGTRQELCVIDGLRHNVSNTVTVAPDEWDEVRDYLYENRQYFTGVSLLSASGDRDFNQAPNTAIYTADQIVEKYGSGAMFASGLIVDGVKLFDDLWSATMIASDDSDTDTNREKVDSRADWIRRFRAYAKNYFDGDMKKAEYCLKDVHLLHKWEKVQNNIKEIDFVESLTQKEYTDINTMGSAACVGGACEI